MAAFENGDYRRAVSLFEKDLAQRRACLPEGHYRIPSALERLGWAYEHLDQHDRALPLYEEAISIQKALGCPHLAVAINNLAMAHKNLGNLDQAMALYEESLVVERAKPVPNAAVLALVLGNQATVYGMKEEYKRALALAEEALALRSASRDAEESERSYDLGRAMALAQLSSLHQAATGAYDKVLPLAQEALALRRKHLPPNHPEVADILSRRGDLHYEMGQYGEALLLHNEALKNRKAVLPRLHTAIAESFHSLAAVHSALDKYDEAVSYGKEALRMRRILLPKDHRDIAQSASNLGVVLSRKGNMAEAERLMAEASQIDMEGSGGQLRAPASLILIYQARTHLDKGDYDLALPLLEKALSIQKPALSPTHPDIARTLDHLATVYQAKGAYAKALELRREVLGIRATSLGPNHPDTVLAGSTLGQLYERMGDQEQAVAFQVRVDG